MGAFPDVVSAEHEILTGSLLEVCVELIAKTMLKRTGYTGAAREQRSQFGIGTDRAG